MNQQTESNYSLLAALRQRRQPADGVWPMIPEQAWRYSIITWAEIENGRVDAAASGVNERLLMIEDEAGQPCGYLQASTKRWGADLPVYAVEFVAGFNVHAAIPSLLRALAVYGEQLPVVASDSEPLREIAFSLGRTHPVYEALGESLAPVYERPYAWYVRIPDLPAFLQHIAPVLERRLADSILAGYTGELRITFYRDGLRLNFEQGVVTTVESWQPLQATQPATAAFPALVFLQLLFGYRCLEDLCSIFPDVRAHNESRVLLDVLFPVRT